MAQAKKPRKPATPSKPAKPSQPAKNQARKVLPAFKPRQAKPSPKPPAAPPASRQEWLVSLSQPKREAAAGFLRTLEGQHAKAQAELRAEKEKRRSAERELAILQDERELILQTRDKIEVRGLKPSKLARSRVGNATAVILASDFHIGATVDPEEVDGSNQFDVAIATKRLDRLWQKAVKLIEFSQGLSHITEVVLWAGGDLVGGSLFRPSMAESNELGPSEEVVVAQDLLATGIEFLRKQLKMPLLVVTSHGNHARTEQEKRSHGAYKHNLEYIIYRNLERKFAGTPRLSFKIEKGIQNWVPIRGEDFMFQHGDALKYAGGVGGLAVPLRRAIGRWSQRRKAKCCVLGHWHSYTSDWDFIVNGSLIGYDSYAMEIAATWQPPVQGLMVVGPPYGKIFDMPIYVAEKEQFPAAKDLP